MKKHSQNQRLRLRRAGASACVLALLVGMLTGCGGKGTDTERNSSAAPSETVTESAGSEKESASAKPDNSEKESASTKPANTEKDSASESESSQKPAEQKDKLSQIPGKYRWKNNKAGTVVTISYETDAYGGRKMKKEANVYLPFEYDENKQYNILYCMHGGGGNIRDYFSPQAPNATEKLLFDNMIAFGDVEPFIAVAPTYYGGNGGDAQLIEIFCEDELINDLMPAVEGQFSTYAKTADLAGFKESRDHRAYSGFSMGALSTWYTFVKSGEYFRYYLPLSGDCWANGNQNATAGAKLLEQVYQEKGFKEDDFFIYAVTGDDDLAFDPMKAQMAAMKLHSPSFHFVTPENPNGNIVFRYQPGSYHNYACLPQYFYNALPVFWSGAPVYPQE